MKTHYSFENDELTITTGDVETTIEASNCADDDVTITYHELAGVVGNLHRRILDQRETLDKLPKCWRLAGGKLVQDCPVVPSDTVCRDGEAWLVLSISNTGTLQLSCWNDNMHRTAVFGKDCANSPEAAKALAERSDDAKETKTS